jgi:NHL repeat
LAAFLAAITWATVFAGGVFPHHGEPPVLVEKQFFGSFQDGSRLTVDERGYIYVTDEGAHSILVFDSPDHNPRTLGGYGWDETTFDHPSGVATDVLNIYVADFGNHRISRFDRQLTFLSSLSTRDTSYERARFGYPRGVAISRQGDLFVLDGENLRVAKFDSQSRFERSFGDTESPAGRLATPLDVLVSDDDHVLVLEPDRIIEYDYLGNFVSVIHSSELKDAKGFCSSRNGIFVVEPDRLLFFNLHHELEWFVAASDIVSSQRLTPLKDVALRNNSIILLTSSRAGIFQMVQGQ